MNPSTPRETARVIHQEVQQQVRQAAIASENHTPAVAPTPAYAMASLSGSVGPTGESQEAANLRAQATAGALPAGMGGPMQPAAGTTPAVRPVAKSNPNSTQNTLQIAEIRDGIVIMNDGSYRSVIMVKSINFDLMSQQEQEAIEYGYQGFLNSLYFPIQIFMRSAKVDLQPYLDKLDKIRSEHDNMLLAMLMDDYIDYMDQLSQHTNIMDKKFYLIIPYSSVVAGQKKGPAAMTETEKSFVSGLVDMFSTKQDHVVINEATLEKAKTELRNRVQSVLAGLMQCGVKALPLDTQELIELYYDTYNPDTATRQQLKNFNGMTADIIQKGQGAAPQAHLQGNLTP
jgi:hypothetical protein